MMTACDLSAITKPWEVQSKVRSHAGPQPLIVEIASRGSLRQGTKPSFASSTEGCPPALGLGSWLPHWKEPMCSLCIRPSLKSGDPRGSGAEKTEGTEAPLSISDQALNSAG